MDQLSPPASDASDDERVAVPSTGGRKKVSNKWEKADGVKHADGAIPDDYVTRTLEREPPLPPIEWKNVLSEIQWVSATVLTVTPLLAIYGMFTTPLSWKTFIWSFIYYFFTGLGITAGYHRLWAHRSYTASLPLQYFLAFMGTGAVQGSIHWWARGHRAHHRYTDTDLDPYGAHNGLLWSHLGWMIVKPRRKPGVADISDLRRNSVIKFQHKFYLPLILIMGFVFPTAVAGFGWGDWRGGFFYAAVARLVFVHHSTFCVNSLAHWLGEASFDNKMTPRDHFITALVTVGEGYHNFHHQFPMDYRNAIKWHQYDPTKWFIGSMKALGLASHLKTFPDNEIKKGQLAMQLQQAHEKQEALSWPKSSNDLPVISWDEFKDESKNRPLVCVAGFIHDISSFLDEHPGGRHLLAARIGQDCTSAFNGGVYDHSNAAHNLLSMMRVGVLDGGYQLAEKEKVEGEVEKSEINSSLLNDDLAAQVSARKSVSSKATAYVVPGQAYHIDKRAELKANVRDKSGKVGRVF
ncbi:hypothetical protein BCV69DRAFT_243498 [Microstroma glucosiphilum]|uniref:Acyl-CoA desaturase n=1 Tax=Pseudomicrostroma glucosiphilum TaxID=1684307 RepID=A0A316ULC3_9BASI|nr:hypothetical protein BCV69DRAFT_243498 [Pseudomicrostroma glucosiphilum]PWN24005.1 hypothetical protein BCV69DRAFT_243498 [Pseudomicrostroma glucosiphilum]